MKTILITAIGGDIAQGVAQILKESRPEIRLIGTDMNQEHGGVFFVDEFVQVPIASSAFYLDSIRGIIDKYSIDMIIPMSESELLVFSPLIDELGEDRCITVGKDVITIGTDKLKTMYALTDLGLETPWTIEQIRACQKNYHVCSNHVMDLAQRIFS